MKSKKVTVVSLGSQVSHGSCHQVKSPVWIKHLTSIGMDVQYVALYPDTADPKIIQKDKHFFELINCTFNPIIFNGQRNSFILEEVRNIYSILTYGLPSKYFPFCNVLREIESAIISYKTEKLFALHYQGLAACHRIKEIDKFAIMGDPQHLVYFNDFITDLSINSASD